MDTAFEKAYRSGVAYFEFLGFTRRQSEMLASLRMAFLMYPEAYM